VSVSTVPLAAVTAATTVIVAVTPFERLPRFVVTVPFVPTSGAVILPWLDEALANTVPVGSAFETTTPVASSLPLFDTVIEYVSVEPDATFGGAASARRRSADGCPPPPPDTTLYTTVRAEPFATASAAFTVKDLGPVEDVSIAVPLATGP